LAPGGGDRPHWLVYYWPMVAIFYYGRTYQEDKTIGWRDGLGTIYCILRYNLLVRYYLLG